MDSAEERLRRLAALNGGPLKEAPAPVDVGDVRRRLKALRATQAQPPARIDPQPRPAWGAPPAQVSATRTGPPVTLDDAVPGVEILGGDGARAYLITTPAAELDGDGARVARMLDHAVMDLGPEHWCKEAAAASADRPVTLEDVVFLDLETTGLSNSPLFLIGAMAWEDGGLVVRQYLARDLDEEAGAIAHFAGAAADRRLLVTFNGRTFDMPYLQARAAYTGVRWRWRGHHLDLLPPCRRRWRADLGNCKLQTLERHICGRERDDDIPGGEVPEAYYAFLRTGNAADLARIVRHNAQDLLTLAELTARLWRAD